MTPVVEVSRPVAPPERAGSLRRLMRPARSRFALSALLAVGAMPACGGSAAPGPPLPPAAQVVEVVMEEYRFVWTPPTRPGRVVLRVRNGGRLAHDLVLAELPDDLPPILEQLRGDTRRNAQNIANLPPRRPGTRTAVAVDLRPGRYGLVCFVQDPDGQQHGRKGMAAEFRIDKP